MATATRTLNVRKRAGQQTKFDFKEIITATIKEFGQDDLAGLATESAYNILFSIFPLAIFGAEMCAILNRVLRLNLFDKLMAALTSVLPPEARTAIADPLAQVLNNQHGGLLSLSIVLALWSGSNAIGTFLKGLNRCYDVEETRPIWQAKGLQVLLTLFMGALSIVAFTLIAFGGKIGDAIAQHMGLGHAFTVVWNLVRWPIVILFIMFALAVLYWAGPNVRQQFKWITPGAVVATIGWIVAIFGFGFYASHFGSYDKTYGTLGGIIILMFVFYLSSLIILFGAELNSELAKRYDPTTIADIAAHPEKDKGETIYADKGPKKTEDDRESDLKGAAVRGDNLDGPVAAPDAKIVTGNGKNRVRHPDRNGTGTRDNDKIAARAMRDDRGTRHMTTTATLRRGMDGRGAQPPSKRAAIGVGLMGATALGLAAKKLLRKA